MQKRKVSSDRDVTIEIVLLSPPMALSLHVWLSNEYAV